MTEGDGKKKMRKNLEIPLISMITFVGKIYLKIVEFDYKLCVCKACPSVFCSGGGVI